MTNFVLFDEAMTKWRKQAREYINSRLTITDKYAKRIPINFSVPQKYRKQAEEFIKSLREKADAELADDIRSEEVRLETEFIKTNPIPSVKDF